MHLLLACLLTVSLLPLAALEQADPPSPPDSTPAATIVAPSAPCAGTDATDPASEADPAQGDLPKPEDFILLTNQRRLQGYIVERTGEGPDAAVTIRTRAGMLVLPASALAKVEKSLEKRRLDLDPQDYAGHLALAREAYTTGRHNEAYALLAGFASDPAIDLAGLRMLATLTDMLFDTERIEEAIALYERYRDAGGRDPQVLKRLDELNEKYDRYTTRLAEWQEAREANRPTDGYEVKGEWRSEDAKWANPVVATVEEMDNLDQFLRVRFAGGDKHKAALLLRNDLNLRNDPVVTFLANNPGERAVPVSVAIKTGEQWQYFESRRFSVPPGSGWQQVSFDLTAEDFKSAETSWRHTDQPENLEAVHEVQIQFHNGDRPGTLFLNGIGFRPPRAAQGGATGD